MSAACIRLKIIKNHHRGNWEHGNATSDILHYYGHVLNCIEAPPE